MTTLPLPINGGAPHHVSTLNVVHIITGLETGGAERMLAKLVRATFSSMQTTVVSLTGRGTVGASIEALGVPVHALEASGYRNLPGATLRLVRLLRRLRPDLVQTWMYHADLIGGLAARVVGGAAVVWNLRNSDLSEAGTKARTRRLVRINARFSHWLPHGIVCCSEASWGIHKCLGYSVERVCLIPNGFDLERFVPNDNSRHAIRAELGFAPNTPLVGLVARYDPQKDHTTFLAAAGRLREQRPDVGFVLVGPGIVPENADLVRQVWSAGVTEMTRMLGERDDVPELMASFDVVALSSAWGEAFPNVIGEAMACGVPCVVTNVGDSAAIVGETGRVVAVGDAPGLAAELAYLLALPDDTRRGLGKNARARVVTHYGIDTVATKYERFYRELIDERQARHTRRKDLA